MSIILHATDLRFGASDGNFLSTLLLEIDRQKPSLVVFTGDFTQNGRKEEFIAARDFLNKIDVPVLVVPGDRDLPRFNLWQRFTDPMKRYRDYISPLPDTVYEDPDYHVVGVNTAHAVLPHWNLTNGLISPSQIDFVHSQFRQAPHGSVRILACHHPLGKLVRGAPELTKILYRQCVDVVLTSNAASLIHDDSDGPVMVGASRQGYNLVRLFPEKIHIELVHHTAGEPAIIESLSIPRRHEDPEK